VASAAEDIFQLVGLLMVRQVDDVTRTGIDDTPHGGRHIAAGSLAQPADESVNTSGNRNKTECGFTVHLGCSRLHRKQTVAWLETSF